MENVKQMTEEEVDQACQAYMASHDAKSALSEIWNLTVFLPEGKSKFILSKALALMEQEISLK